MTFEVLMTLWLADLPWGSELWRASGVGNGAVQRWVLVDGYHLRDGRLRWWGETRLGTVYGVANRGGFRVPRNPIRA